jgi:hypothetical protein
MRHSLKSLPEFFEDVLNGTKTFEIRLNDRGYQEGDVLWLREWSEATGYTGRDCLKLVIYMTTFEQKENYVVMGIREP